MIIRAKTLQLFEGRKLSQQQDSNTWMNLKEAEEGCTILRSYPRRLVFELTNACNLNCIMCGRNAAVFQPSVFPISTFKEFEPIMDYIEEVTLMGWGEPTIHPHFNEMLRIIDEHHTRKYFCTNGMNLKKIKESIFKYKVDVFAVSVDGASFETNARIRRGSDLDQITSDLKDIIRERRERNLTYPYINFVFCAMKSNIEELPELVRLAAEIGIDEVKVVYLTVFDDKLCDESLWGEEELIKSVFASAEEIGEELGIVLKLPHIPGEDIAEAKSHKDCFVPWRDFFLGSDGYVRPCMSTPTKLFKYDNSKDFKEIWNSPEFQGYRKNVNDENGMDHTCKNCYQSSFCNWNKKESFIHIGEKFSPEWDKHSR